VCVSLLAADRSFALCVCSTRSLHASSLSSPLFPIVCVCVRLGVCFTAFCQSCTCWHFASPFADQCCRFSPCICLFAYPFATRDVTVYYVYDLKFSWIVRPHCMGLHKLVAFILFYIHYFSLQYKSTPKTKINLLLNVKSIGNVIYCLLSELV